MDCEKTTREAALQATLDVIWRYAIPLAKIKDLELREELRKLMEKRRN